MILDCGSKKDVPLVFQLFLFWLTVIGCCCCPFESFEDSFVSLNYNFQNTQLSFQFSTEVDGDSVAFGFWSFSVPLLQLKDDFEYLYQYKDQEQENGQLLLLLRTNSNQQTQLIIKNSFDYERSLCIHTVILKEQITTYQFNFPALEYEGKWIFHFLVFQPLQNQLIIYIDTTFITINQLDFESDPNFLLEIGGKGYSSIIWRVIFLCADCFFNTQYWYLQPVCKFDLKNLRLSDNTFIKYQRQVSEYDVYFINENYLLELHPELQDICISSFLNDLCSIMSYYHLENHPYAQCKMIYYYEMDLGKCISSNENCIKYDQIDCLQCKDGMTNLFGECIQCPLDCLTCEFNMDFFTTQCTTCNPKQALVDGQCRQCGQFCENCQNYYDSSLGYSYIKCLKCIDDSKYYITLDSINCEMNKIYNCLHVFQANKFDILINNFETNFLRQNDLSETQIYCAACLDNQFYIPELKICIDINEQNCLFGYAHYDYINQDYIDKVCLIAKSQSYSQIQFFIECGILVKNCKQCLSTNQKNFFICLECENDYYADRQTGQCFKCPENLNCMSCYQENKIINDHWKNKIRAFYRHFVEQNIAHEFTKFAQTSNVEDYQILCESCKSGYRLVANVWIPYCSDDCIECNLNENRFECAKCKMLENERQLSIENNQCIDCPGNCVLCRTRSNQEITQINPLFENEKYLQYSRQCLRSLKDQNYYYDTELSVFQICDNGEKHCYNQIVIPIILQCNTDQYFDTLYSFATEEERKQFLKLNQYIADIVNNYQSFNQFENDEFYLFGNKKSIRSILIKLPAQNKSIAIQDFNLISQLFSKNIFTAIDVELEMDFQFGATFIIEFGLEFRNFKRISIKGLEIKTCYTCSPQKVLSFKSQFRQEINLKNIFISKGSIHKDQFFIQFYNFTTLTIDTFVINQLTINQVDQFITIFDNKNFNKQIVIKNLKFVNCQISDQIFINAFLKQSDYLLIQKQYFQSINFFKFFLHYKILI